VSGPAPRVVRFQAWRPRGTRCAPSKKRCYRILTQNDPDFSPIKGRALRERLAAIWSPKSTPWARPARGGGSVTSPPPPPANGGPALIAATPMAERKRARRQGSGPARTAPGEDIGSTRSQYLQRRGDRACRRSRKPRRVWNKKIARTTARSAERCQRQLHTLKRRARMAGITAIGRSDRHGKLENPVCCRSDGGRGGRGQ